MTDLDWTDALDRAIGRPPAPTTTTDDLLALGRRGVRRRRLALGTGGVAAAAVLAASLLALTPHGTTGVSDLAAAGGTTPPPASATPSAPSSVTGWDIPPGVMSFRDRKSDLQVDIVKATGVATVVQGGSIVAQLTAPGGPGTLAYDIKATGSDDDVWLYHFANGRGVLSRATAGTTFTTWAAQLPTTMHGAYAAALPEVPEAWVTR